MECINREKKLLTFCWKRRDNILIVDVWMVGSFAMYSFWLDLQYFYRLDSEGSIGEFRRQAGRNEEIEAFGVGFAQIIGRRFEILACVYCFA